ncbi:MAG: hypothetical protein GY765_19920 [bacterium]|nr:hypothetical protein [bacterium]
MKNKKITIGLMLCILIYMSGLVYSQAWNERTKAGKKTFEQIRKDFYKEYGQVKNKRAAGWKQFKRWEWFAKDRLDANGYFDPTLNWKGWEEKVLRFGGADSTKANANPAWTQLGPTTIPEDYNNHSHGGMGRLNCITFHPSNRDIIWVGSPSGGLWKTTDGGQSWMNTTDNLPNLGVSSVLIDPRNANVMYMATGDGDGADTFSIGILKSTDGGVSWNTTGMGVTEAQSLRFFKLIFHPSNPDIILAVGNGGIYKSTDAGANWARKSDVYFKDIEVDPSNASTWYASTYKRGVFKSTDTGESWTQLTVGIPAPVTADDADFRRIAIAVAPSSPATVYALYCNIQGGFYGLYRSTDRGATWELRSDSPNILGWYPNGMGNSGQGNYDLTIDVSPEDSNHVFIGGINLWHSTNGGENWTPLSYWASSLIVPYVHADQHAFAFHPDNPGTIFVGNDGGLFKSTDRGVTWTDLSSGLAIHQIYRIAQSTQDDNIVVQGTQDNGSDMYNAGRWYSIYDGDGMECAVDPGDSSIIYCSIYHGSFFRSINSGESFQNISSLFANSGAWITPFAIDPTVPTVIYAATTVVFKSNNRGTTWDTISGTLSNIPMTSFAVAPSNSNVIYTANGGEFFRTTDGGANWASPILPDAYDSITRIAVDPNSPNIVWVTMGNYRAGRKVFRSANGGDSWQNLSGSLVNIPVNCLAIDPLSGGIYLGTDLGVFYAGAADGNWVAYDNGLPNVIVNDIELHLNSGKIRIATYGRGLWEAPLAQVPVVFPPLDFSGERKKNRSMMQTELVDVLTWAVSPNNDPAKVNVYRIYKLTGSDYVQVAEVNSQTFEYLVRGVEEDVNISYYISTIDTDGNESLKTYTQVSVL